MVQSSSTFPSRPSRISSETQPRMWDARSSLLKEFSALDTADTCMRISGQYASASTIFCMPLICPSTVLRRVSSFFCSASVRSVRQQASSVSIPAICFVSFASISFSSLLFRTLSHSYC